MASNKVVFEVIVADNGTLKLATKDVKSLGAAVDTTAASQKRAEKAADGYYNRQEKGIIGTANNARSFSKLASTIGDGNNGLVGAYAALAANIFAVTAAFSALKAAAEVEQVLAGINLMGARTGQSLSTVAKELKEITNNAVSTEQALRSTAQIMSAGFGTKEVAALAQVAKDTSFALGRETTESLDRLVRGAIKLEPELLDELGIMVRLDQATSDYARTLNKSAAALTVVERRQAFMNAIIAEGTSKFGGISEAAGNTTAYVKLLATFKDLTKEIFNLVNVVGKPLALLFSASPGALLGGMILFAGSIRKQILPGIVELADKAAKAAEEVTEVTKAQAKALAEENKGKRTSSIFSALLQDVNSGTADLARFEKAYAELQTSRIVHDRKAKDAFVAGNSAVMAGHRSRVVLLDQEIAKVKQLVIAESSASALSNKANALASASQGKYSQAWEFLTASVRDYNKNVIYSSTATGRFAAVSMLARTSMYAFATGVKVLGVALLNALPVIGQVIFVVSLLLDGLKALMGDGYKAAKEALDAYTTAQKDFNQALNEYNKLQERAQTLSDLVSQRLIIAGNSVITLSTSMDDLVSKKAKLGEFQKAWLGLMDNISKGGKASTKSKFRDAFPELKTVEQISDLDFNSEIFETLIQLQKIPETAGLLKKILGPKGLAGIMNSEQAAAAVKTLQGAFANLAASTTAAKEAIAQLDKDTADFLRSSAISTPFDKLVKSSDSAVQSVGELSVILNKAEIDSAKLGEVLSGVGPDLARALGSGVTETLEGLKLANSELNEFYRTGKQGGKEMEEILLSNVKSYDSQLQAIQGQLVGYNMLLIKVQTESRLLAGNNELLQSQISLFNGYTDASGQATKKRLALEDQIKENQISVLDLTNDILKSQLDLTKAQLDSYNVILQSLEAYKKIKDEYGDITKLAVLQAAYDENRMASDTIRHSNDQAEIAAANETLRKNNELISQLGTVLGLESSIRDVSASIAANNAKIAALRTSMKTQAQKEAEAMVQVAEAARKTVEDNIKRKDAALALLQLTTEFGKIELNYADRRTLALAKAVVEKEKAIRLLKIETAIELAQLNLEYQNAVRAEGANSANAKALEKRMQALTDYEKLQSRVIEQTYSNAEFAALELKTYIEMKEQVQQILETQLDILDVVRQRIDLEADIIEKRSKLKEARTGIPESAFDAFKREEDLLKKRLEIAREESKIKKKIIDIEYDLLSAKIRKETADLKAQRAAMITDTGALAPGVSVDRLNAVDEIISANEALASMTERARTAAQSMEDLKITSAELDVAIQAEGLKGAILSPLIEQLKALGPQGEAVSLFAEGVLTMISKVDLLRESFEKMADPKTFTEGFTGALSVVSSVLDTISSIVSKTSEAKISNIDQEIAAEQKRDGKSAESVAKIAALEKKKDQIAKKTFETNKKLQMAQAVISTASAVAQALASLPFPANIALAALIGGLGAAQLSIIAGTQYQSASSSSASTAAGNSTLAIGGRGNSVDLARSNPNAGGESGYITGSQGSGSNPYNFRRAAYGAKGYGAAAYIVGEKGPEIFTPEVPGTITPNDQATSAPAQSVHFAISTLDAEGVEELLLNQRGNIIGMLREAANANGQSFLENVDTATYTRRKRL